MDSPLRLAQRAATVPASPIRRLAPLAAEARARGRTVHPLNIGQPDLPTPREMLQRLRTYSSANVPYGPSQGLPEMLDALRRYYRRHGVDVAEEEIFVTTGGSEALLFVLGLVADPGDRILVFEPFYTNYNGFSALLGIHLDAVRTRVEDGFHLPPMDQVESALDSRTRAVLICSPNNPTGTVYRDDELEALAELCRRRGLFLISDEVYREFTYDGRRHRSVLTLPGLEDRAVVVDSLSKRVSFCGGRVGCIVSRNRDLMDAVLRCGQARLCPPTLAQHVGAGLAEVPEAYTRSLLEAFQARRDVVYTSLLGCPGVTLERPEGAFYVCPRLPIDDGQRFAEFLLRDFHLEGETVMVAPADGFYASPGLGRDEVRIAYVLDTAVLARAMEILRKALEVYPGRTP